MFAVAGVLFDLFHQSPEETICDGNSGIGIMNSTNDPETDDQECIDLALDVYDIIKGIQDPEKDASLEDLEVVKEELVSVTRLSDEQYHIKVVFVPTVPHCSLANLIGLSMRVKLQQNLMVSHKLDISVQEGSHSTADEINKQINDKERVAAAKENEDLMEIVNTCIAERDW